MKIGIDIGGSHVGIGLVDEFGNIQQKKEKYIVEKIENESQINKQNLKEEITQFIIQTIKENQKMDFVENVGIAVPGTVNQTTIIKAVNLGIENYEITPIIEKETGTKVKLKNEEKEKTTIVPETESFMNLIQSKVAEGNEIELIQKPKSVFAQMASVIITFLPTALMVILIIMIIKMQGLGEKGKVYDDTERKTKIKFDDVAGLDEEKEEMINIMKKCMESATKLEVPLIAEISDAENWYECK